MELILLSRFIIDLLFWTYLFSSISAEVNYWLTYLVQISKGKANITYIKKASNTNNLISTALGRQRDLNRVSEIMFWTYFAKGQLISKADWHAIDSPKKRTDEFVLFAFLLFTANKSNSSVRFLGESTARQSAFRN